MIIFDINYNIYTKYIPIMMQGELGSANQSNSASKRKFNPDVRPASLKNIGDLAKNTNHSGAYTIDQPVKKTNDKALDKLNKYDKFYKKACHPMSLIKSEKFLFDLG